MWIMTSQGWRPLYRPCVNSNDLKGVYTATTLSEMRSAIAARCERFNQANGIQNMLAKQEFFAGDSFREPLFGAFGEKL